ncbi:lower collar protein [Bacillus phage vB_Bpu_PumA2]|uniref:Lower collar protein n=1 Tax=Bacillus phage vB_Bpu_PumA2 TaxID=2662128 RepID=A0A5Q2WDW2_9CAUD|nr:adaptor Ad4 [Bacillus phage vB_Bpu_PumA2]QGH74238.1 lower collar protein [Bacillus phage vB_Bpu_PumA2]
MSSRTTELRYLVEMHSQHMENVSQAEKIEIGRKKIFNFKYPFFSETYRSVFETNFLRTFYFHEIGFETEAQFFFHLETWLNVNMGYWSKMFESELIEFDPLKNVDITRDYNKKNNKEQDDTRNTDSSLNSQTDRTSNVKGDSRNDQTNRQVDKASQTDDDFNRNVDSKMPDTRLTLTANDGEGALPYASEIKENTANKKRGSDRTSDVTGSDIGKTETDAVGKTDSKSTANTKDTFNSSINNVEDYIFHEFGKAGTETYSEMLEKYRGTLLRIERMIFDEMRELFLLIY